MKNNTLVRLLPAWQWLKTYKAADMQADTIASIVFTIMVIPQSLAYAMLAGLPAITGLYASILPSILYSLFGTSRILAVGPVAITSVMTASAVLPFATVGTDQYATIAILLALLSGTMLLILSILRLGFLTNLLSHPVISGFISASALLIILGQVKHLLGVHAYGDTLIPLVSSLAKHIHNTNIPTLVLSIASITSLVLMKRYFPSLLKALGCSSKTVQLFGKSGSILVVAGTTIAVGVFSLDRLGVSIIGAVPSSIPTLKISAVNLSVLKELLPSAFLISIVGFVGSVSVAQTYAAKYRQDIDPNQELMGLGMANIGSALCGAFPVTGGFSRTVLNAESGAKSPMTGIISALLILLTLLFLTPLFYYLPTAILSSIISISMLKLVNIGDVKQLWRFSKKEAILLLVTFFVVLLDGMETGLIAGVVLSLLFFLWHTSHPHIAIVGRVPGTEHFRNEQRFAVEKHPHILTIRIDENLFFANARVLEDRLQTIVSQNTDIKHLILMCNAVNMIDASAMQSLEKIVVRLSDSGVKLHLSEVKGPVMDKLKGTQLLNTLTGEVFLTQHQAIQKLEKRCGDEQEDQ
ncbi:putative sulfate transporter/MT1781 [Marinomonas spartinae]|uniref:SulP family inorganic anion transporter n=1 Tax=Marinomonas spartinae TaxID=1792290 RepID=UPI000809031C|nr:sulfate permease [Marinomonas spartinae]SBS27266.1 putative sulfate transporter/MT1781 [Marinomonas spartinae]